MQWNIQVVNIKELHKRIDPNFIVELELVKNSVVNQMSQVTKLLGYIKELNDKIAILESRRY
jgi:hypothetical protein